MHPDEEAVVMAFIAPDKRGRYQTLLTHPRRRTRFTDRLNHALDYDPRFAAVLPSGTDVVALLRSKGAPDRCHLISASLALDGRDMLIEDAIAEIEADMWGTLVSCIRGRLAYYYGEAGSPRILLERTR